MKRDGDGSAREADTDAVAQGGDQGQGERLQTLGQLFSRPPAPDVPLSQPFSVELFAPPNTQELSHGSDATMMSQGEDLSQRQDKEDEAMQEVNENVLHVREILDDMLRTEAASGSGGTLGSSSSSEKDREEKERLQLYQLRCCVLDDANLEELEKLPKRMCAYEFKPGDIAWNCRVCQVNIASVVPFCLDVSCGADCVTCW